MLAAVIEFSSTAEAEHEEVIFFLCGAGGAPSRAFMLLWGHPRWRQAVGFASLRLCMRLTGRSEKGAHAAASRRMGSSQPHPGGSCPLREARGSLPLCSVPRMGSCVNG